MISEPVFTLRLDGAPYTGWKEIEVARAIDRMGGEFSLVLTSKPEELYLSGRLLPGISCTVEIDQHVILDGYVDAVSQDFDKRHVSIKVSGRDRTCDLIDCAASVDGPFEFNNMKLEKIIEKILKPYKINLTVDAETGAAFKRMAIQPGETAFEFIERACRYRAVLPISDGVGGLVIVKPGTVKSPGRLVYGENILSGNASFDWRDRFSLYVVKSQGEAYDETTAEEASQPEGRAKDDLVTRYRPKVIVGENQGYELTLKERAEWEAKVARARSLNASYNVQGWYISREAEKPELWKPNTIVSVKDPARSLNREMLITGVTYIRNSSGTITTLQMTIPEAFDLIAEKEETEDPSEDLWGAL